MTDKQHKPTTEQVRDGFRYDELAEWYDPVTPHHVINGRAFDRWLNQIEAAAEQRGAVKALRDAADYLAENKQIVIDDDEYTACNSCTVIQYDYLTYRADQMEGDDGHI